MTENPGTDKVEDLLKNVHDGSYVIPYFQRGFEWQPSMVCDLVESILQNYYTGLILLWDLNPHEAGNEKWDPVWGAELRNTPSAAILDGQQRLSSLYYALYNPDKKFPDRQSYYAFFLDLNKALNEDFDESVTYRYSSSYQSFDHMRKRGQEEWAQKGTVPLSLLSAKDPHNPSQKYIDSQVFEQWVGDYLNRNRHLLPQDITTHKVYKVLNGILTYSFVMYPLSSSRDLHDICNIFARVNAKGLKLSTFDLMNAFLYPKNVELRKDLWENLNNETLKNIDSNMNEYLLKLVSLIKQNYCSSKYIYNLIPGEKTLRRDEHGKPYQEILVKHGEEFKELWKEACRYAEKARGIIMNTGDDDLGAIKPEFVPNTTIVPVLGALLWAYQGNPEDADFRKLLKRWYWSAVLSEDYSGSSDTVMAKDFRDWKEWIRTRKIAERARALNEQFISELDLKNTRKGSARYNAIICILALNDAKDFFKGRIVGVGDFSNERINDHHIFPRQVSGLDPEKSKTFSEYKDYIVNRSLLMDESNNRIRNKKPSDYVREMLTKYGDEEKVKSILKSHLINEAAFECMKSDDFDGFIIEREKAIKQHLIAKLDLNQTDVRQI